MTDLRLLGYVSWLAVEQQFILKKQFGQISKLTADAMNLLGARMNSDRRRNGSR